MGGPEAVALATTVVSDMGGPEAVAQATTSVVGGPAPVDRPPGGPQQ